MASNKTFCLLCGVVTLFVSLAGIFGYYFISAAKALDCPVGQFPCLNSTKCLAQKFICDTKSDCPLNDDELVCANINRLELIEEFMSRNFSSNADANCIKDESVSCQCKKNGTILDCDKANITNFPSTVRGSFNRLQMRSGNFPVLKAGQFINYNKLIILILRSNQISLIEEKAFFGLEKLEKLVLTANKLTTLSEETFNGISSLLWLALDDNQLENVNLIVFKAVNKLDYLTMSNNHLTLHNTSFPPLEKLRWLELHDNKITDLHRQLFSKLTSLEHLSLNNNLIERVDPKCFQQLEKLTHLSLAHNRIKHLDNFVFRSLVRLYDLDISFNPMDNFGPEHVQHLAKLNKLAVEEIIVHHISTRMFENMSELFEVYFYKFRYCRYVPKVRVCRPNTDGISSNHRLLANNYQRICVWTISTVTIFGNFLVVLFHAFNTEAKKNRSHIFIINLAVGDWLMGIYLLIIAITDIVYQMQYHRQANNWMSSMTCTVTGFIGTLSSEVSIIILCAMTIERKMTLLSQQRQEKSIKILAWATVLGIWSISAVLAIVPMFIWRHPNEYYGSNGVCYPLHIDNPNDPGRQYSTFLLLGVNLPCVVVLTMDYIVIFHSVWSGQRKVTAPAKLKQVGVRVLAIVVTDCLCWIPIIIFKILALANIEISENINSWTVICIMPINSAINPVLYTFVPLRKQLQNLRNSLTAFVNRHKKPQIFSNIRMSAFSSTLRRSDAPFNGQMSANIQSCSCEEVTLETMLST